MPWERYNFTDDFQEAIIACMIRYPKEFNVYGDIVKPEFFNGIGTSMLMQSLMDYEEEYGRWPNNFSILGNYTKQSLLKKNPQAADEVMELCGRLAEINTEDYAAVRDRCLRFAKERASLNAVKKIHYHITEGTQNQIDVVKTLTDALATGTNMEDLGLNLYDDWESIVRKVHGEAGFGIQTGYPEFDKIWKTGWHPGWLIAILAPPKRYKTTFCLNLALKIAGLRSNGGDVLYYACEISQELAAMRAIYNLSNQTEEDIMEKGVEKFIQVTGKEVKRKMKSHVWFKGFSSKMATIHEIHRHARMLKQQCNINPKAIIIDYAETVKPSKSEKNTPEYRSSAQVYVEARAMGGELGACVIMPDRCNKETVGKKVPNMGSFQGSFEKAGIVDAAIGLCGTNAEILQNKIRYFLFLNRHGPQYLHFEGKIDKERYRMTIDRSLDYDESLEEDDDKKGYGGKRKKGEVVPPNLNALMKDEES